MDDVIYINGVRYIRDEGKHHIEDCYEPSNCTWYVMGERKWRCNHGTIVTRHPNAYCNGGCCR